MKGLLGTPKYPVIGGHEGSGIVESVGEGVTAFKKGDHVIPLVLPQCRECQGCKHPKNNICDNFLSRTFNAGADQYSPMSCRGEPVRGGISTFSEYSVVKQEQACKINPDAPLDVACLFGCGIPTGYGAAINSANVKAGSTCAIWGLGAIGLAAVMGCKNAGAAKIIAIDINPDKFALAKEFGATECINPNEVTDVKAYLIKITGRGVDYTFEAVGAVPTMQQAIESSAIGYGVCVLIGTPPMDVKLPISPFSLQMGRTIKGTMIGDWKSKDDIPKLVDEYMDGKIEAEKFITHKLPFEKINEGFDLLREGKSIRTVLLHAHE